MTVKPDSRQPWLQADLVNNPHFGKTKQCQRHNKKCYGNDKLYITSVKLLFTITPLIKNNKKNKWTNIYGNLSWLFLSQIRLNDVKEGKH